MLPPDRLDELLERWRGALPPLARDLAPDIWRRIETPRPPRRWRTALAALIRPPLAIASAIAVVSLALLVVEMRRSRELAARNAELARRYVQWIDPQFAAATPAAGGATFETELGWMRETLHLTAEQFERVKQLHERSSPRLLALAAQVAQMREEFAAFEEARRRTGEVDFLEFARFVAQRRNVDREWIESRRALIFATAGAMPPPQREAYLALFQARPIAARPGVN